MKEDNKSLCEYGQDCVKAGYEKALQKINKKKILRKTIEIKYMKYGEEVE